MKLRMLRLRGVAILTSMIFVMFIIGFTNNAYAIDVGILPFDIKTILGSPGKALIGIVVNPATNKIYVGNTGDSNVAVIDGATDTLLTTIALVSL